MPRSIATARPLAEMRARAPGECRARATALARAARGPDRRDPPRTRLCAGPRARATLARRFLYGRARTSRTKEKTMKILPRPLTLLAVLLAAAALTGCGGGGSSA